MRCGVALRALPAVFLLLVVGATVLAQKPEITYVSPKNSGNRMVMLAWE
jgi:hypothetical protein